MVKFSSSCKAVLLCGVLSSVGASTVFAQTSDENAAEYSALLQQIADRKLSIAQKQVFVAGQEDEISSLETQLEELDGIKEAVPAIVEKMTAAIEGEIAADYPFATDERLARLARLQDMVANPEARLVEKYRTALDVLKIEVNYGQSLETYPGNHPINPTIRNGDDRYEKNDDGSIKLDEKTFQPIEIFDGNYMRYGRTAFVYLSKNGSGPLRYDLGYEPTAEELADCQGSVEKCRWRKVPGGKSVEIRRAIRVSRGEVAPTVVAAPVSPMP